MNRNRWIVLSIALAGLIPVMVLFYRFVSPRILARAVSPDGVEMCLVQDFNWDGGEPFTTSFVFRKPGRPWGRFYAGHQDSYFVTAQVSLETNARVATFHVRTNPFVKFAWDSEAYWLKQGGPITGAQWQLPSGWSPGQSVR